MIAAPESLYPLPQLYRLAARELPEISVIPPAALPVAAHRLLVHAGDMTSKLEEFFADEMRLQVLQLDRTDGAYRREVLLRTMGAQIPVEYGAIEIHLAAFPAELQPEIVAGALPLGGLMNRHGMKYRSEPLAFLRVAPCTELAALFQLPQPMEHFGRANRLLAADGTVLAQIVEILRPV